MLQGPGAKLLVTGPVVARRGVLLLTAGAVKLLGGSVEELQQVRCNPY